MVVITLLNIVVVFMAYLAREEKHRYLLAWAFVLLSCVLGIRYGYGNDFFPYLQIFNYSFNGWDGNQEYGWYVINCLFHPFGFSSLIFFLTCLESFIIYKVINEYVSSDWFWFAMFIYVFNISNMLIGLSMLRQELAMCIGLYALKYVNDRKIIPFLILCTVASSMHSIAYLLFPLYLLPYANRLFSNKWGVFVICLVLYIVYTHLGDIVFGAVENMKEDDLVYANSGYIASQELNDEKSVRKIHFIRIFIYLFFYLRSIKYLNDKQRVYSNVVLLGYSMVPFVVFIRMIVRASWIYTIAEIVAFPLIVKYEKNLFLKTLLMIINMALVLFEFFEVFYSDIYGAYFYSYRTIFDIIV